MFCKSTSKSEQHYRRSRASVGDCAGSVEGDLGHKLALHIGVIGTLQTLQILSRTLGRHTTSNVVVNPGSLPAIKIVVALIPGHTFVWMC